MRTLQEHRDRLAEIDAEITAINTAYEGRRFPDDVREDWNRLNAERDEVQGTVAELEARHERLRKVAANPAAGERFDARQYAPSLITRTNPWSTRDGSTAMSGPELASRALDAVGAAPGLDEAARDVAARLVSGPGLAARGVQEWALATSDPEYERAFGKVLADPMGGHRGFTTAEAAAFRRVENLRYMALSPDTAGGHLTVPFQLDPSIMLSSAGSVDPFRQVCRRVTISMTDTWKGVTSEGVTAAWYGEGAEVTDDSPDVADVEIPTHRASAFVGFSIELDQDFSRFRTELAALFTDAKTQLEATAFTTGTGTGQPTGVLTALGAGQTVTTGVGAYVADDSYALLESVPARFRARTRVLSSLPIMNITRRFTTDTEPEIVNSDLDRWLGRPLHETSTLGDTVTTGSAIAVAGDWSQMVIVDRTGASVELLPLMLGANRRPDGRRGLFLHWRVGADVLVPGALRKLVVG